MLKVTKVICVIVSTVSLLTVYSAFAEQNSAHVDAVVKAAGKAPAKVSSDNVTVNRPDEVSKLSDIKGTVVVAEPGKTNCTLDYEAKSTREVIISGTCDNESVTGNAKPKDQTQSLITAKEYVGSLKFTNSDKVVHFSTILR